VEHFIKRRLDELENRRAIVDALARHPEIGGSELKLLLDEMDRGKTSVMIMARPL
jgi:hypothetical protein